MPAIRSDDPKVKSWLKAAAPGSLYVSVLTMAELRRGMELLAPSKRRDQLEEWLEGELLQSFEDTNVLPVTKPIGDRWAVLSARAQGKGIQLAVLDGLIRRRRSPATARCSRTSFFQMLLRASPSPNTRGVATRLRSIGK